MIFTSHYCSKFIVNIKVSLEHMSERLSTRIFNRQEDKVRRSLGLEIGLPLKYLIKSSHLTYEIF